MSPELPRRPFTELTPPPDGFALARNAATRRRRTKTAVASTSFAGAAVAVLALVGSSSLGGDDSLRVTDPAGRGTPTASAPATGAPAPTPSGSPDAAVSAAPASPGAAPSGAAQAAPASPAPYGSGPQPADYGTPDLQRSYVSRATPTGTTFCSGSESGNTDPSFQYTVNWCTSAVVSATTRGHDLTSQICRDSSSDATLTYAGSREVDLVVRGADGKVVWRWSVDHPDTGMRHQLAVAREHCWVWTARWTDVDSHGRRLPRGSYTLSASTSADELSTKPQEQVTFTI